MSYYIEDDATIVFMLTKIKEWKNSNDDILLLQVENYKKYINTRINEILESVRKDPKSPFNDSYMNCVKVLLERLEKAERE